MLKKLSRKEEGFTIIEVLIVLAIAGLIMLIVFLAVPALQRNNRNTTRTSDVQRILGAAQEVLNNNNGSMTALTTESLRAATGTPAYYTLDPNVTVTDTPATVNPNSPEQVVLVKGARCTAANDAEGGTTRQLVALFSVESGSGPQKRCQSS